MAAVRELDVSSPVMPSHTPSRPVHLWSLHRVLRKTTRLTLRCGASLALIAATTFTFSRIIPLNATTAGFVYLVAILQIATAGGLVESTIASFAAMLCFNFYFLPPLGTFTIADPQNWVALFAFLATSLTASQLSARAKGRAQEAEHRTQEIERLYSLSRALLLLDASRPIAGQIVQQISMAYGSADVVLYVRSSGEIYSAGTEKTELDDKMHESAVRSTVVVDEVTGFVVNPIRLGGEPIGSLGLRGGASSDAALQSLVNLVAIGLERGNAQKAMTQAEVARQSEELKSTMLDALAHEFKTPLTSIKAASTDLLSMPEALAPHHAELISIVDEAADRLSKLVTDAIQLARIEGGTFGLNLGTHFPSSLVSAGLRQMKALTAEREIVVRVPEGLPPVRVDAALIVVVITHLLDNALKYSPPKTAITIAARLTSGKIVLSIADHGKGISAHERDQIFDKFYRGRTERHLQGTGMGLAIAREILRAHGEDIAVESSPQGSEFSFSLPLASGGPAQ